MMLVPLAPYICQRGKTVEEKLNASGANEHDLEDHRVVIKLRVSMNEEDGISGKSGIGMLNSLM